MSPKTTKAIGGRVPKTEKASGLKEVTLRLHEIECIKTTKEIDRDEMVLTTLKSGAVREGSKARLKTHKGEVFSLGKFKKGTKETYRQPKKLATFSMGQEGGGWPRHFPATLVLIEKDEGEIGAVVNKLVDAVDDHLAKAVKEAGTTLAEQLLLVAGPIAASNLLMPIIGPAIATAVTGGIKAATAAIKNARKDDVFDPKAVPLELKRAPGKAGEISGSRHSVKVEGHKGVYRLEISWAAH